MPSGPQDWRWLIGLIPAFIAKNKGRNFALWWLYGSLLFIFALIHSLVMKSNQEVLEQEALRSGRMRECPHCVELIKREANVCRYCGRDVPPLPPTPRQQATIRPTTPLLKDPRGWWRDLWK